MSLGIGLLHIDEAASIMLNKKNYVVSPQESPSHVKSPKPTPFGKVEGSTFLEKNIRKNIYLSIES